MLLRRCPRVIPCRARLVLAAAVLATASLARLQAEEPGQHIDFERQVRPLLKTYCFDCHSGEGAEAGLDLSRFGDVTAVRADRELWEKVFDFIRIEAMPPVDADQPTPEERQLLMHWLDYTLFYVDCKNDPDPGRVTVRRLNRTEYNNTIRDLIGVDFQPAADFPSDDVGYGFDNIGDVLSISPLHMEKYLDAAEQIAQRAILTPEDTRIQGSRGPKDFSRKGSVDDGPEGSLIFVSSGTISTEFTLQYPGEYELRVEAGADQAGDEPAKMEVRVGDKATKVFEIKGHQKPDWYVWKQPLKAGKTRIAVSFTNDYYNPKSEERGDRNLYVRALELTGPAEMRPEDLPDPHRRLIVRMPKTSREVTAAANGNIKRLLTRAFRRPVSDAEAANYSRFVRLATDRGDSFERGMQVALSAILVSPEFLFRIEDDTQPDGPEAYELNQYEIASRLSYFLWSSMPDEELFNLARAKKLQDERTLQQQVDRMLQDQRSQALIDNFAGQWLGLRNLNSAEVMPDTKQFPQFTPELRRDIGRETYAFVSHIVREDRSILELLDGRYTFLNERLAKLYGVEGVQGDELRKVDLTDGRRAGLLTQASILTLTSYPGRTSPVKRGEWVLSNILGDEPPPPPPLVPGLEVTREANPDLPLRKQLEIHRSDPGCASCHRVMDAIGFGFENFDAIGRWRNEDNGHPIDSAGQLPTGESFRGPAELIAILRTREDEFSRCLSEKLLTYAIGRGLEYYDRCAVDRIVSELGHREYRFSALLKAIVTSRPFLMRRGETSEET